MASNQSILPADIMESQLSTIDLLAAMFPSPGELEIPESTTQCIEKLREWCENPSSPPGIPSNLSLAVYLPIEDGERTIQVNISVPLQYESQNQEIDQPPPLGYSLRQPDWLSRAEVASITASIPQSDDALEVFEYIQAEAHRTLENKSQQTQLVASDADQGPIVRVWFYFPSLSTRKKRDDMVNLAPAYSLTGFVLAGKPGVLCLEGVSADVDSYMSFIKTHSWGDIPSHQKKVSERFREVEGVERVFPGMEEITDSLGERSGQRANRGDMQALEAWLGSRGLQEAFEKVIF
ncbi:unnamed protein product [Penicillium salamii]|uniref:Small nuclear ribonucleoprotein Prp3 C-terminal domain-containing protein n=1 Tax=Penicillium salamii TaxID=1612424 RepID=A0A9W4J8M2_9EURO|nr:unnamed protein product [Penicillium salamii]CAG7984573.1 unnamed protein product [Penicillium salamii]CAG8020334.1 unnamed protein product [Penicillium salamii]CAG8029697.1 unnamed protein product [Penicillium salamii]CAG8078689.1 unnamed protein product [Penicillium salamii]